MRSMQIVTGEGDCLLVDVRGHLLELDQPVEDGGRDSGPTPTELFVASVGSCVAHYARRFLRRHGLPEDVQVDVSWRFAKAPTRVGSVELDVWAPGLPRGMRARFETVVSHCTVHNSLAHAPDVAIRIASRRGDIGVAG